MPKIRKWKDLGRTSKKLSTEFKIINPQTKQNHMHIPGFRKANGFAGKALEKISIISMFLGLNKQKNL
jgi:hypothetical protein